MLSSTPLVVCACWRRNSISVWVLMNEQKFKLCSLSLTEMGPRRKWDYFAVSIPSCTERQRIDIKNVFASVWIIAAQRIVQPFIYRLNRNICISTITGVIPCGKTDCSTAYDSAICDETVYWTTFFYLWSVSSLLALLRRSFGVHFSWSCSLKSFETFLAAWAKGSRTTLSDPEVFQKPKTWTSLTVSSKPNWFSTTISVSNCWTCGINATLVFSFLEKIPWDCMHELRSIDH